MKKVKIKIKNLSVSYGEKRALNDISIDIYSNKIFAFIGPSGCGKTTLLRSINRMNDFIEGFRSEGAVEIDGVNIYNNKINSVSLRKKIGMVFQQSIVFPKSIYENLIFGPRLNGIKNKNDLYNIIKSAGEKAALWDEIKDRLNESAMSLSEGQRQRLCIARALSVDPEILLLDEPASSLDPIATAKIEELLFELKEKYAILIVTHNMQQAARVSDYTAFLHEGNLIECDKTTKIFTKPVRKETEDFVTGRFG